jgi:hypothetical protein
MEPNPNKETEELRRLAKELRTKLAETVECVRQIELRLRSANDPSAESAETSPPPSATGDP